MFGVQNLKWMYSLVFLLSVNVQAEILKCGGTEPFWSAVINTEKKQTRLMDPEISPNGVTISTEIQAAAGTSTSYAFLAKGKYTQLMVMENATCSDGMSDDSYTHSVMVLGYTKAPIVGCCRK